MAVCVDTTTIVVVVSLELHFVYSVDAYLNQSVSNVCILRSINLTLHVQWKFEMRTP